MKVFGPALALAAISATAGVITASTAQTDSPTVARAQFTEGAVVLPVGYRQWHHIGTRYKPIGVNILDGKVTETPEIFNAYVEPGAMATFEKTGQWPDGAQIVKEFSAVQVGQGCDPKTFLCITKLGSGIFESGFVGLGMMVKDSRRFPDSPGHWGYFTFGHKPPPYNPTAQFDSKCVGCHINLASDTDYVISKAHIGLARGGPN